MSVAVRELQSMESGVSFSSVRLDAQMVRVRTLGHKSHRHSIAPDLITECENEGLTWCKRVARLVHRMCDAEKPVIYSDEQIVFTRTVPNVPPIYTPEDWHRITLGRTLHELGPISNICADWGMVLSQGLLERKRIAKDALARVSNDSDAAELLECALETLDAVLELGSRYAEEARRVGKADIAQILEQVPGLPPRTFHEALQSLRLLHSVVWMSGHYHVGLGRIDQYLWPYLRDDLESGRPERVNDFETGGVRV